MACGEKKDPEWSGVTGDDVAVEGEAAACGKATGELEMDVGVVLPVVTCVDEPVDAPEESEDEKERGRDAGGGGSARSGCRGRARLGSIIKGRDDEDEEGAIILEGMQPFLELVDVHVARGGRTVLHGINLRVETGEQIAILGPNGCGKSTLIKTMTCECYPLAQEGTRVSLFGRERWDLTDLKRRLGVVSDGAAGQGDAADDGTGCGVDGVLLQLDAVAEFSGDSRDAGEGGGGAGAGWGGGDRREAGGRDVCGGTKEGDDWAGAGGVGGKLFERGRRFWREQSDAAAG